MATEHTITIKLSPIQYKLLFLSAENDDLFKEQNKRALSLSVKDRFGGLYSPLIEGDLPNNMGKILINLFSYSILEGLDMVPIFDRDDLLSINAEIMKGLTERETILNIIRNLSPDEKAELLEQI